MNFKLDSFRNRLSCAISAANESWPKIAYIGKHVISKNAL